MTTNNPDLPEIRIYFSRSLYENECQKLESISNIGNGKTFSLEAYIAKTDEYRKVWAIYGAKILTGMTEALNLTFYRPVIDVAIAPYFRPKSAPLILNARPDPDSFVDVLTHELLHVLQTDNNKHQTFGPDRRVDLLTEWVKLFGDHKHLALVHIPLHAIHKYIYLDVLKAPERFERELSALQNSPTGEAYIEAWDYVNRGDYVQIIEKTKAIYDTAQYRDS